MIENENKEKIDKHLNIYTEGSKNNWVAGDFSRLKSDMRIITH